MSNSGPEVRAAARPGGVAHFGGRLVRRLAAARRAACSLLPLALALVLGLAAPASAAPYVFIDPGHGGPYSNANRYGLREKHVNLWLGLELRRQLQLQGFSVGMTRSRDRAVSLADIPTWEWSDALGWRYRPDGRVRYRDGVPRDDLQARVDLANRAGADLFVSIHNNGARGWRANGTEVWASDRDRLGVQLSRYVQTAVVQQTRLRSRGAFKVDFYVVRWANMPAVLVEGAFITNRADARRLSSPTFRRALVRGIVIGINRWLATNPFGPLLPRYAGETPAEVAAASSLGGWPEGAETVLLASTAETAYAVGAPSLSRSLGAPLLFAEASGVPPATAAELARLRPKRLIALASGSALPSATLDAAALAAGIDPADVRRVAGEDPYAQSALIAAEPGVIASGTLVVTTDARAGGTASAASAAASLGGPVLLVPAGGTTLPGAIASLVASRAPEIGRTLVIGDAAAVPDSVLAGLPNAVRLAEPDVFRDNASLSFVSRPSGPVRGFVVTPDDTSLGIVAGVAASRAEGGTLVLNAGRVMSPYTRHWITAVRERAKSWTIVGGTGSQPYLVDYMVDKARK